MLQYRVLTIPLSFNTGEEVHTTEAQGMGRNQGYVHLQREQRKKSEREIEELLPPVVTRIRGGPHSKQLLKNQEGRFQQQPLLSYQFNHRTFTAQPHKHTKLPVTI